MLAATDAARRSMMSDGMGNWECLLAIKEAKKAVGNGDEWLHPCEEEERRGEEWAQRLV
jgi:hypothetical protein